MSYCQIFYLGKLLKYAGLCLPGTCLVMGKGRKLKTYNTRLDSKFRSGNIFEDTDFVAITSPANISYD